LLIRVKNYQEKQQLYQQILIFIFYNLEAGETKNMTQGMMGFDVGPVFSPDGNYMAWESMERDGYESDKKSTLYPKP